MKQFERFAMALVRLTIGDVMTKTGVSRSELARRLKVSRPMVTHILSGRQNMTIRTMVRVLRVLGYELNISAKKIRELV